MDRVILDRKEVNALKNNIIFKFAGIIASLALMVTVANVNSVCMFIMHQPKLPEGADKLRRF